MPYYISPPPQNPLTRIIAAIIAVFVLVGSFMIGMVALVVVAAVGAILAIGIWLRIAWIKRRMKKEGVNFDQTVDMSQKTGQVIDAEYTVISETDDQKEP